MDRSRPLSDRVDPAEDGPAPPLAWKLLRAECPHLRSSRWLRTGGAVSHLGRPQPAHERGRSVDVRSSLQARAGRHATNRRSRNGGCLRPQCLQAGANARALRSGGSAFALRSGFTRTLPHREIPVFLRDRRPGLDRAHFASAIPTSRPERSRSGVRALRRLGPAARALGACLLLRGGDDGLFQAAATSRLRASGGLFAFDADAFDRLRA
jgi:hypothetical protein